MKFTIPSSLLSPTQSTPTGYDVFASPSNFAAWWLGLLVGWTADHHGLRMMLFTEAALGVVGIAVFFAIDRLMTREARAIVEVKMA